MSNNQSPFSYVPVTNLTTPPNNQLRHIRLLPAVWNPNAPLPNWSNIQQTINLTTLKNNRYNYERSLKNDFELKITNNKNITPDNKKLLQSLLSYYYISALSPSIYGVYLDGKALIDEVAQSLDNRKTNRLLTRYADAMTAASMFGVFSAHNNRNHGEFNSQTILSKSVFFDICSLPIQSDFNPTAPYRAAWESTLRSTPNINFPLVFFPFEQIKSEITGAFNKTRAEEVDFVNDVTNSKKDLPTIAPVFWLDVFNQELKDTNANNHGLSLDKKY